MRRKRGMRKKHGIIMALLCMLVFVLTACGGDKAATAPAEKDTLVVADGASPKTLDPRATNDNVSARVMVQIYDTLVEQDRSEEHTSELQSRQYLVCRLLLEKKNKKS